MSLPCRIKIKQHVPLIKLYKSSSSSSSTEDQSGLQTRSGYMDFTHTLLNYTLVPFILILFVFIYPPLLVFKFFYFITRSLSSEDVAGKVVLITGASSGIGEYVAYEYAKRGARLALVARRKDLLRAVADKALEMGSPDVLVIPADVSKVGDAERFVEETVDHFGRLDHLVNNAGILRYGMFEDCTPISDYTDVMNVNFWGSVYCTQFALPHLKKSRGRIVVIASAAGWFPQSMLSFYNASKAAVINFFETLRSELGYDIRITIISPGVIDSEMTRTEIRSLVFKTVPVESTEGCAKAIMRSVCRGDFYMTEPYWANMGWVFKVLWPEGVEYCVHKLVTIPNLAAKKLD